MLQRVTQGSRAAAAAVQQQQQQCSGCSRSSDSSRSRSKTIEQQEDCAAVVLSASVALVLIVAAVVCLHCQQQPWLPQQGINAAGLWIINIGCEMYRAIRINQAYGLGFGASVWMV